MRVTEVTAWSEAARAGVRSGDELTAIGGVAIRDGIDVAYALGALEEDGACEWRFERAGATLSASLPCERPDDLGMELAPDAVRTCPNRCPFCFVDQLPPGLRDGLYVKDEDYRLSFAFGNYITLTNLSDADYERIAEQRLSPLYVSVHATDDAVRREMLGSPGAPPIMDALGRLAAEGIAVHTQIVVCPDRNDGEVLEDTLADLESLGDVIRSIAVVPVGLTAHRRGLPPVRAVTADEAGPLVDAVERWQDRFRAGRGRAVVFAADELYLLAGRTLPPLAAYEDLPQLENGVGLLRSFEADFKRRVAEIRSRVAGPLRVTVATGTLAAPFLERLIVPGLAEVGVAGRVLAVVNTLLGATVTVAGLLSGADLARAIADAPEADLFLVPGEALNDDGLSLDGMTVDAIAEAAGGRRVVATNDPIDAILDFAASGRAATGDRGRTTEDER